MIYISCKSFSGINVAIYGIFALITAIIGLTGQESGLGVQHEPADGIFTAQPCEVIRLHEQIRRMATPGELATA